MNLRTALASLLLGSVFIIPACSSDGPNETPGTCGNGVRDGVEACDVADFGGKTCESLGFAPGTLTCVAGCATIDAALCGAPANCGDNVKDGVESCDGTDLDGNTCATLDLGMGTLGCKLNCSGFDTTNCAGPASCGNGQKDGAEICDGTDLGGNTCESAGAGTGTLACAPNCIMFDTSGCVCVPACSGLECGVDPACGQSCGECGVGDTCEANKCIEVCDLPPILMNTTLNLDLKTVKINGAISLNGAVMPNDGKLNGYTRGLIRFRDVNTLSEYTFDFGETGAVNYSLNLFAGVYDVFVVSNKSVDQTVLPNDQTTRIIKGLDLKADGVHDIDLKTVTMTGNVTLNGAAMPNDMKLNGYTRGVMRFRDVDTFTEIPVDLGETGPVSYSATMFASTYDVLVVSEFGYNQTVLPPSQTTRIQKGLALSASGTKHFDVKTVNMTGKVTLNGATMPNDMIVNGYTRGVLRFRDNDTFSEMPIDLGETGGVAYSTTLFAGNYDVLIDTEKANNQSVLPPGQSTRIQKSLALTTSGTKDFDAKTITMTGKVTLNGATMPNDMKLNGYTRGALRFRDIDTFSEYVRDFGETGGVAYSITAFTGAYDVLVTSNKSVDQTVLPDNKIGMLQKGLPLTANGTKDFDIKTAVISGKVTLNGVALPSDMIVNGYTRGLLRFRDVATLSDYDTDLMETGPFTYSGAVFAGVYDVFVSSNKATDQNVLPGNKITRLEKAVTFAANATKDYDLKTAKISGTVTLNGAVMPNDAKLNGYTRGLLRFQDVYTVSQYDIDLLEVGPVNYSTTVFIGGFDVFVVSGKAFDQTVLPGGVATRLLDGCSP